jgi:MFS family permease
MPAAGNIAAVIIFSVVFGFASGSNISLVPVCVGELCPVENYGRYYTTVYTIVSFGYVSPLSCDNITRTSFIANPFNRALTGVPIAGEILHRCNGQYWGLISFAGCAYAAGIVCFSIAVWLRRRKNVHSTAKTSFETRDDPMTLS